MSKWNLPPKGEMDKASGIYFQNMTQKEIVERRKKNDVIIVPIGSTETHGPGEPLGDRRYRLHYGCVRPGCAWVDPRPRGVMTLDAQGRYQVRLDSDPDEDSTHGIRPSMDVLEREEL